MLWILYRIVKGKVEFLGVYPSEESAKADVAVTKDLGDDWEVASVLMLGWNDFVNKPLSYWLRGNLN